MEEVTPETAPEVPTSETWKPLGDRSIAWHKFMLENWRACRPMFWAFPPTHRVNFCVADKEEMLSLLTREELDLLLTTLQTQPNVKKCALFLRMPYEFIAWVKKNIRNEEFKDLRVNRKNMTIVERMDRIVEAMVTEIEDRMANISHRANLETDNLVQMVKNATAVQKTMEESDVETGTTMNIVSHMPAKDDPDDDGGETVH